MSCRTYGLELHHLCSPVLLSMGFAYLQLSWNTDRPQWNASGDKAERHFISFTKKDLPAKDKRVITKHHFFIRWTKEWLFGFHSRARSLSCHWLVWFIIWHLHCWKFLIMEDDNCPYFSGIYVLVFCGWQVKATEQIAI